MKGGRGPGRGFENLTHNVNNAFNQSGEINFLICTDSTVGDVNSYDSNRHAEGPLFVDTKEGSCTGPLCA